MRFSRGITHAAILFLAMGSTAFAQSVTGAPVDLTFGSITKDIVPRLSFDGTKVTYTETRGNHDLSYTYNNVWLMNNAGGDRAEAEVHLYFGGTDEWSSVSPDGTKVVLHCTEYSQGADPVTKVSLYIYDFANSVSTRITNTPSELADDAYPTWSSDGKYIVFLSDRATSQGAYQLFAMKPEVESLTNVPFQLTSWTDSTAIRPICTPDGKVLFERAYGDGTTDIYKCDISPTAVPVAITSFGKGGKYLSDASQATSGGKIFFLQGAKDGRFHVFSMNPNGSAVHQVTGGTFTEDFPCAAADKLVVTYYDPANNGVDNGDVGIYSLTGATGNGTVSGKLTSSAGNPQAGATVNAYDGANLTLSTTTNASGQYTLSLPPGGYTIEFVTTSPDSYTVTRSVAVPPGGSVIQDAFTTPTAAPRPNIVIATIKGGQVAVKWQAGNAPTAPYAVSGYNIYRGASETGPWTKVNTAVVPATNPFQFLDTAPGDLSKAFYTVTTVTANGATTLESAFADVSQAANNLLYNPSFETIGTDGIPVGWTFANWGSGSLGGTASSEKTDGAVSAVVDAGTLLGMYSTKTAADPGSGDYEVPNPGTGIVEGVWARAKDYSGGGVSVREAPNPGQVFEWYADPGYVDYDSAPVSNPAGDMSWTWTGRNDNVVPWEFTQSTRFTVFAEGGQGTGVMPLTYVDEATYQVRRFGATGMVYGRIADAAGKSPAGVTILAGGKTLVTDGSDPWVFRDVPTGVQTLTIQIPGKPDYVTTIGNFGGYRVPDYILPEVIPFTVSGYVKYPDGKPCPGADVRLEFDDGSKKFTTTTDATGYYKFVGTEADPIDFAGDSHIVAHKAGYLSTSIQKSLGASGWAINDLQLGQPSMVVQISKVTGAAPAIDGNINLTTEYAGAQEINFPSYDTAAPFMRDKAYMKWDTSNLYIAYVANEPNPAGMLADATGADNGLLWWTGSSWNADDIVTAWLDPNNGDRAGLGYEQWQMYSNSIASSPSYADIAWRRGGDQYATPPLEGLWGLDNNIDSWTIATKVDSVNHKWYTEWKVPFSGLTVTTTGSNTLGGMSAPVVIAGTEWVMDMAHHRHQPLPDGQGFDTGWFIAHFVNTVTPYLKGDINGDGIIDMWDAKLALAIAAGLEPAADRMQGNINADSIINLTDAAAIIEKANGKNPF